MEQYIKHSENYPYIIIRAMSAVYSVKYPDNLNISKDDLLKWAKSESKKWNKRVCAVFSKNECVYIELNGTVKHSNDLPAGGIVLTK